MVHPNKVADRWACEKPLIVLLACIALLVILFPIIMILAEPAVFKPLVQRDQWATTGDFPRLDSSISDLVVPGEILSSPDIALWRSWRPETGGTIGTVESARFHPTEFMAIPFYGAPWERPDVRIYLRCEPTGHELEVATQRTNDQWATAFIHVQDSFCPGEVALVASTTSKENLVGVGTPFQISRATFLTQTGFGPRLLVIVGTWLLISSVLMVGGYLLSNASRLSLAGGFTLLAALGMLVLSTFMVSAAVGRVSTIASFFILLSVGFRSWMRKRRDFIDFVRFHRTSLLLWLSISISYAALVSAGDSGGGSWAINNFFSPLRWSSDNQLPLTFAENLFEGASTDQFAWGPWLASDRTPLFGALLLLPRVLLIWPLESLFGHVFVNTAYMMAGLTLLSSWVLVFVMVTRRVAPRAQQLVLILAATSPFFIFNSVFTWGKLLGGSYVVLAFYLLHFLSHRKQSGPGALLLVACCSAAAYLSHASNAFALVPLALFYSRTIYRQGLPAIATASALALGLASPWLYWQAVVQPHGNALLRFALAGDFGFENRTSSILGSVISAYGDLGVHGWASQKLDYFRQITGLHVDWRTYGESALNPPGSVAVGHNRVLDFFVILRSIGTAAIGIAALPITWLRGGVSAPTSALREAAWVGAGALLFTILFTLPPPFTHHQAYGGLMLLFLAGSWSLARMPNLAKAVAMFSIVYCGGVWLWHPLAISLRVDWLTVFVLVCSVASTGYLISTYLHSRYSTPRVP